MTSTFVQALHAELEKLGLRQSDGFIPPSRGGSRRESVVGPKSISRDTGSGVRQAGQSRISKAKAQRATLLDKLRSNKARAAHATDRSAHFERRFNRISLSATLRKRRAKKRLVATVATISGLAVGNELYSRSKKKDK